MTAPAAGDAPPAGELIPVRLAEQRAHARIHERDAHAADPLPPFEVLLAQLEQHLDVDTRVALHRVAAGDWSAITIDGDSGHGASPAAAIADLLRSLS